jgi:hypothetical protein
VSDLIIKATLPAAVDLIERWFKYELNDKTLRVDSMKFLQACGKLKPLSEAISALGKRVVTGENHE